MNKFTKSGQIIDLHNRRIFQGTIHIDSGIIVKIEEKDVTETSYILPGFVDAHIHIESSMLVPSEFSQLAVIHGTVGTVSDPHEIANVCGLAGVRFMIENAKTVPFHFYFGASPCVPATSFETSGAKLSPKDIKQLFTKESLRYLSEMMNYPGVLSKDSDVMEKIAIAKELGKPIDGHAPGLTGDKAKKYINAGISTDHECFTLDEALYKINHGMKIIIREGSAAKNFDALHPLLKSHPDMIMFCNDDKHPDDLLKGHINEIVKKSIQLGYDIFDVLRSACLHPINHYKLDIGTLKQGDPADFIIIDDLNSLSILKTYINGVLVADNKKSLISPQPINKINNFKCSKKRPDDFGIKAKGKRIKVIKVLPGELITEQITASATTKNGYYISNTETDILKLVVVNRYNNAPPVLTFIKGFKLKKGALASSVSHDSHNIIAVGVDDTSLCIAVNNVIESKGGLSVVDEQPVTLQLPIAGLMSDKSGLDTAIKYSELKQKAKLLGSNLADPFMTLSFMALLVIPSLKLSDKGLFDGNTFSFTQLEAE